MHPTTAKINLSSIQDNVRNFKKHIGSKTKFCAVLKADAYGHGAPEVAKAAIAAGANWLATAFLSEAMELRSCGIKLPILVLGYLPPEDYRLAIENNLTITLMTASCAEQFNKAARSLDKTADVHVKVNTGMNRIGIHYTQAADFIASLHTMSNLNITGIYSHFSRADETDLTYARLQLQRFNGVLSELKTRKIPCGIRHICNSAATLALPEAFLDMVRVGISLYGLYPSAETIQSVKLKPAMQFCSVVSQILEHNAGEPISYGNLFTTGRKTVLAVIPAGYADGYMRNLSNNCEAIIKGHRVRQVGRICMDQCMFDITGLPEIAVGDEVVLFGSGLPVEELAEKIGTINYELCCAISKRVPRKYEY